MAADRPRILIVKAGSTAEEVRALHGDYDRWFSDAMGAPERFTVVEAFRGEPLPSPAGFDGVIVTGSPLSVCDPAPWMETAGATLREWVAQDRAVLGVCFGHQLLAHALGTPVIKNPRGREIGTIAVELTAAGRADALFEGLGPTLRVQATHTDVASAVPTGTRLLAGNANTDVQALWFGKRARGVQFHPELSAGGIQALIRSRRAVLSSEGLSADEVERAVIPTPDGVSILKRFEERLIGS